MAGIFDVLTRWLRSPAFKFGLITVLVLLLLIPLFIVGGLVSERESRASAVRREVGHTWGPEQRLIGPLLVVPYTTRVVSLQGDKTIETIYEHTAVFTPLRFEVSGALEAKTLRRSIFEVPVYTSRLKLSGTFATPVMTDLVANPTSVRWREATLILSVSGVNGLKEAAVLKIAGGNEIAFAPSLGLPANSATGIHARLAKAAAALLPDPEKPLLPFDFSIDLAFNGSVALEVAPVARETHIALSSNWPHPSFAGTFLPDERKVTPDGFTASWKIPHLARSVPESWIGAENIVERFSSSMFGVRMVSPVDFYTLVNRATKYGVLFLTMAFMAVFCLELISKTAVHSVQYLFTGLALVFFYVLLLSLAEHIGFNGAYGIAAIATSGLLSTYLGAIFKNRHTAAIFLAALLLLYLVLYFILQLEDYALLVGALLGFVALFSVMFATLRVDWSGQGEGRAAERHTA